MVEKISRVWRREAGTLRTSLCHAIMQPTEPLPSGRETTTSPARARWAEAVDPRRARWAETAELAALFIVGTLCAGHGVALGGFALGWSLHAAVLPAAVLLAAVMVAGRATERRTLLHGILIGMAGMVAGFALALAYTDISYDGLYYHQGAILELAEGWNPLRSGVSGRSHAQSIWADHYPKAAWVGSALGVQFTGRLDAGKWLNLPLLLAAGAAVGSLLLRATRAPGWLVLGVAVAVAANPVALGQLISGYVDGPLGATLTVFAAALGLVVWCGERRAWWLLGASLWFAMNVKQSGVAYAALLCAITLGVIAWRTSLPVAARTAGLLFGLGLVGAGVFGYSPYVQNILNHRHPFYPLIGAEKYDMVGPRRPPNLPALWPAAYFMAQFARTDPPQHKALPVELKFPLALYGDETQAWASTDPKSGGFGPFYGAMLLLGLGGAVAWARAFGAGSAAGLVLAGGLGVLLTCSHYMCWWARYVPQGWWLAWIVPVAALGVATPAWRRFTAIAVAIAAVNGAIVLGSTLILQGEQGGFLRNSVRAAAAAHTPLIIHTAELPVLGAHLRAAGVAFHASATPAPAGTDIHPLLKTSNTIGWWREPR